jgi:hypothetical protein
VVEVRLMVRRMWPAGAASQAALATIAAGERPFRPVIVQMSGCRVVSGLGPARTVPALAFWRTLGKDLGLKLSQGMGQSGGINP